MNLYEYQSKKLFSQFRLPILQNCIFSDISEVKSNISNIKCGPPWIAKCQIHSGGRGKSGGVCIVHSLDDIYSFANKWIGKYLKTYQTTNEGEIVHHILIEPVIKIIRELYFSMLIDRELSQIVCIISTVGGMDIENLAKKSPGLIYKMIVDFSYGINSYQGRILAYKLGLSGIYINKFVDFYINVIDMLLKKDLTLVEVNPLSITEDNRLICLDAKVSVDDNSLFRQSDILNLCNFGDSLNSHTLPEIQSGINYISLNGNIGCMVNGAGLAMATMDLIKSLGGAPANFLDIGGDTDQSHIVSSLKRILNKKQIKAVLINIFGGIVCCNLVSDSILIALSECNVRHIPIVVRLEGNNSELGSNKLINKNLKNVFVINNLIHAIQQVIESVK